MRTVAFLRAINTGNRRVRNADLVAPFVALGLDDATAFQASGNVAFTAPDGAGDLTVAIETALEGHLGWPVPTFLRSADDLRALLAADAFTPDELAATDGNVQVIFLRHPPGDDAVGRLAAITPPADRIVAVGADLLWLPVAGVGRSELPMAALTALVGENTMRGRSSVARIVERYC